MRAVGALAVISVLRVFAPSTASADPYDSAIFVEALGMGGLWGVGVEHRFHPRFRIGAVGSGGSFEDQQYVTLTPYLGLHLVQGGRSAWFVDGGAQVVHAWNHSPVPEWDGNSSTGVGATVTTGYEFRGRMLFRLFLLGAFGKGGALPWAGADIGVTF